ncbi:MAG: hypothetical protein HC785_09810 [Calothrix sp. CSU_2_0]|nr:hypothetical protein [Calothrix sp. CSU_2_0]
MAKTIKARSPIVFILGIFLGYFFTNLYTERPPLVACTGQLEVDSASYPLDDLRSGSQFIENSSSERIYLRFNDGRNTNNLFRKHVRLSGRISLEITDSDVFILRLDVTNVEQVDANLPATKALCVSLEKT